MQDLTRAEIARFRKFMKFRNRDFSDSTEDTLNVGC